MCVLVDCGFLVGGGVVVVFFGVTGRWVLIGGRWIGRGSAVCSVGGICALAAGRGCVGFCVSVGVLLYIDSVRWLGDVVVAWVWDVF